MMNVDILKSFIVRRFGDVLTQGSELRVNCPFCYIRRARNKPDTDHKLYINPKKNLYNCFKCNASGRASELIPQLASVEAYTDVIINKEVLAVEEFPESTPLNQLPNDHPAKLYLINRGYDSLVSSDEIFFCPNYLKKSFSFGPRIIFPIYQFGIYRGFQARAIGDALPKYIIAANMKKSEILYNFDNAFLQNDYLVIVEGIFDALKDPKHAIALFGKSPSDCQIRLLMLGTFKKVLCFLDIDALPESTSLAKRLSSYYNTYLVKTPYKDLGEIPYEKVQDYLTDNRYLERVF